MKPVLIEIPLPGGLRIPLHAFGLMIVLGFLLACRVGDREARRRGLPDFMYDLGLVMLLAGIAGGRLLYVIQFYDEKFAGESFLEFFKIWKGGLVFYGGAIMGFLGGVVYCLRRKLPVAECLDIAALVTPLAMAAGRLGCFLNGCCFGKVCSPDYPLGVVFPLESNARASQLARGLVGPESAALPVHPVQLYQAGHDFLMFALLLVFLRLPGTPKGAGMPLLFVLYGIGRFVLEGFRGDHDLTRTGLTLSQNLSIALFVAFGACLVFLLLKVPFGVTGPRRILEKTS